MSPTVGLLNRNILILIIVAHLKKWFDLIAMIIVQYFMNSIMVYLIKPAMVNCFMGYLIYSAIVDCLAFLNYSTILGFLKFLN